MIRRISISLLLLRRMLDNIEIGSRYIYISTVYGRSVLNHREENVINVIIKLQISSEEIDDRTMSRMFRIILVNRWINFLIGDVFMRKELGKCSNLSLPLEVTITIHNFSFLSTRFL